VASYVTITLESVPYVVITLEGTAPEPVQPEVESGGGRDGFTYGPIGTSVTAKIPVHVFLFRSIEDRLPVQSSMVRGVENRLSLSSTTIRPFETQILVLREPAETYSFRLRDDEELLLSLNAVA
jgi:hypothetical protein